MYQQILDGVQSVGNHIRASNANILNCINNIENAVPGGLPSQVPEGQVAQDCARTITGLGREGLQRLNEATPSTSIVHGIRNNPQRMQAIQERRQDALFQRQYGVNLADTRLEL